MLFDASNIIYHVKNNKKPLPAQAVAETARTVTRTAKEHKKHKKLTV